MKNFGLLHYKIIIIIMGRMEERFGVNIVIIEQITNKNRIIGRIGIGTNQDILFRLKKNFFTANQTTSSSFSFNRTMIFNMEA